MRRLLTCLVFFGVLTTAMVAEKAWGTSIFPPARTGEIGLLSTPPE